MRAPFNAGYSKTPLIKKLGIKSVHRAFVGNAPDEYIAYLQSFSENLHLATRLAGTFDFLHYFADDTKDLSGKLPALKKALDPQGMLWISWRKGRKPPELGETEVRALGLKVGLVDVKVCAIDEVWSALKFVYRVADRKPH